MHVHKAGVGGSRGSSFSDQMCACLYNFASTDCESAYLMVAISRAKKGVRFDAERKKLNAWHYPIQIDGEIGLVDRPLSRRCVIVRSDLHSRVPVANCSI